MKKRQVFAIPSCISAGVFPRRAILPLLFPFWKRFFAGFVREPLWRYTQQNDSSVVFFSPFRDIVPSSPRFNRYGLENFHSHCLGFTPFRPLDFVIYFRAILKILLPSPFCQANLFRIQKCGARFLRSLSQLFLVFMEGELFFLLDAPHPPPQLAV